jgi:hypothetical protein
LSVGKHLGNYLRSCPIAKSSESAWPVLAATVGSTCYQDGSVSRAEAVVYIYYGDVG